MRIPLSKGLPRGPEWDHICGRGVTESKGPSGKHLGVPGEGDRRVCETRGEVQGRRWGDPEARHYRWLQCRSELLWSWNPQVSMFNNATCIDDPCTIVHLTGCSTAHLTCLTMQRTRLWVWWSLATASPLSPWSQRGWVSSLSLNLSCLESGVGRPDMARQLDFSDPGWETLSSVWADHGGHRHWRWGLFLKIDFSELDHCHSRFWRRDPGNGMSPTSWTPDKSCDCSGQAKVGFVMKILKLYNLFFGTSRQLAKNEAFY